MNKYEIRVDGRLYEVSRGDERKDEIMPILESMYGKEHVTCKKLRKNSNMYKWN